ncbi:spore germination protein [Heyndrickxia ginsengihumi]|uniref:Spore germination protein n=1 Tax=Heyndrickxia ginsengihumi TaxID=363870 RepID=A0A0A6VEA0_9BACI|nr:spore germination protein [Heyndrickxia ginsengihumi]KHD85906.1 spore gernimation protein GerPA [Heyndrickxia ginsengihumi]MBE6184907.1 spore germination protein [Bacillus sp. (in: firmicutes)]MCM3023587.1 spore germination protein [Heyndrickxia ginsengihumi]NEY18852.1 spore germination protein [Heyndrickxia ginsengihumi]
MPGFVGAIQVVNISSSGVLNVGDVFLIQPISSSKTFAGAGSFNTGETVSITNHQSNTNTFDFDTIDQGNYLNL